MFGFNCSATQRSRNLRIFRVVCGDLDKFRHLLWLAPLLLYSGDALAWGLYTHVYFAQQLLWAIPADTRFRRAAFAFPG